MRAILINPEARTVDRVIDEFQDPNVVLFNLQCDGIQVFPLGPTHEMIIDELGPFRRNQHWFGIKGQPVSIAGRGLIVGKSLASNLPFLPCQMDVLAVRKIISWYTNPLEAENLVPPTVMTEGRGGKIIGTQPFEGFRTIDPVIVDRNGNARPRIALVK